MGFIVLTGGARPDHHTICEFRQRFTAEIAGLFGQALRLYQEAGLARLGHVSLDGTKLRASASKHKAMSYGRMLSKEEVLEAELRRLLEEGMREDEEEDAEYGPDDDGWSMSEEAGMVAARLKTIRVVKAQLEVEAREKAEATGRDPATAEAPGRIRANFTDPDSRIMKTPDGFQQCYNAQAAVDAASQVIVACEVSAAPPDVQRLRPMLSQTIAGNGKPPLEPSADAGYTSEADFVALNGARNVSIWTASQSNRISLGRSVIGMEHIADSWDKAKIADYIIGLAHSDEDIEQGLTNLVFAKVRNSDTPDPIKMATDFSRGRIVEG